MKELRRLKAIQSELVASLVRERHRQGLSQVDVATMTGLHHSTISLMESEKRDSHSILSLMAVADALKLDFSKEVKTAMRKHEKSDG